MALKRQTLTPRVVQDLGRRSEIGSYYLCSPSFSTPFFILIVGISTFRLIHRFFDLWLTDTFGRGSLYRFIASIVTGNRMFSVAEVYAIVLISAFF